MPSAFIKNCENGDASLRDVELRSAVLENGMENAIITAKCGYNFLLIAQVRDGNGKWKYEDSMLLNAVYDNLVVTLQPIVAPPVEDVVVHAHVSLQGTGIYQANFLILKLVDGRFRVVLDAIEESHVSLNRASQPPIEQKSTFNITPKTGDEAATVDEIQTVTVGNKSTISEREFNWDDNLHVFQVSLWETSKAR